MNRLFTIDAYSCVPNDELGDPGSSFIDMERELTCEERLKTDELIQKLVKGKLRDQMFEDMEDLLDKTGWTRELESRTKMIATNNAHLETYSCNDLLLELGGEALAQRLADNPLEDTNEFKEKIKMREEASILLQERNGENANSAIKLANPNAQLMMEHIMDHILQTPNFSISEEMKKYLFQKWEEKLQNSGIFSSESSE